MDWRIADVAFRRARSGNTARAAAFVSDRGAVEWNRGKLRFTGKKHTIEIADVSIVELTQQWTFATVIEILLGGVAFIVGLILLFLSVTIDPFTLWSFGPPRPPLWVIIAVGIVCVSVGVYAFRADLRNAIRLETPIMIHVVFRDAAGQPCEAYFQDGSPSRRLLERLKGAEKTGSE